VSEPLVCPSCASTHSLDERFCPACGMPLVYAGRTGVDEPVTEAHERARKIKPQFTEGELVRVVSAQHQAEAEMVQGLLLEEGIPSMTRPASTSPTCLPPAGATSWCPHRARRPRAMS
jgi:hypothetical protein